MPSGKKLCESVAEHVRKAPLYPVPEVSFPVRIEFIDWIRLLIYGYDDTAVSFPRRRMVLCACSLILTLACGCKQAPWETLTPQYTGGDLPHLYSISAVLNPQYNLNSLVVSNDGEMLWAVGDRCVTNC